MPYFISNGKLYKQVDEVTVGSSLGLALANAFLIYFQKHWLQNCPSASKPHYHWQYLCFAQLRRKFRILTKFSNWSTCQHVNWKWKAKQYPFLMYRLFVKIKHLLFLSTINIPLLKFMHILVALYHLLISLVLFTDSLTDYFDYAQIGLNYTLNYFFWKKFSFKNGYPENFINKCFKGFMDTIHVVKKTTVAAEVLVLTYLGFNFLTN